MYSLTSALDGGVWSDSRPGHFTPRERAGLDTMSRKIPGLRRESNLDHPMFYQMVKLITNVNPTCDFVRN
jgi:hypothetical protein